MMNLVRWTPRGDFGVLPGRFNRLFNDPFFRTGWADDETSMTDWNPAVDIYDKDDRIVIKAELPGMDKKDIAIDLKDGVLTLTGERAHDNEAKEDDYYRRERVFGKFHRSFKLSADIDPDKIKADFKEGVLNVEIPKPEEQKPKKITVH
jgi:HSP20 family protein